MQSAAKVAQIDRAGGDGAMEVIRVHYPAQSAGALGQSCLCRRIIKREPAGAPRCRRFGVDGDQFKEVLVSGLHKAVVGAHLIMFTSARDFDAERIGHGGNALLRVWPPFAM